MEHPQSPARLMGLSTHAVHQVARFYAAAEATIHGCRAEVKGPQSLVVVNGVVAHVASRRANGAWQIHKDPPFHEDAEVVVFVDLSVTPAGFYVAPAAQMIDEARVRLREFIDRHGGERPRNPDSKHSTIKLEHVVQWRDRWDLFS